MKTIGDLTAALEQELLWREEELRFLDRQSTSVDKEAERNHCRRAFIVMLYAHFEGFTKNALLYYLSYLNSANLRCAEVSPGLAASGLDDVFRCLRDPSQKSDLFRKRHPNDSSLHRLALEAEFLERAHEWGNRPLKLSDRIVDAEDNLTVSVLQKLLFKLGLPYELFDSLSNSISELVGRRNAIAHGEKKTIEPELLNRLKRSASHLNQRVRDNILKAARTKAYLG